MKYLLLILILLGGLIFGAMHVHVILLDNHLKILKKSEMTLDRTFVDARGTKKFTHLLDPVLLRAGFVDLLRAEGIPLKEPEIDPAPPRP